MPLPQPIRDSVGLVQARPCLHALAAILIAWSVGFVVTSLAARYFLADWLAFFMLVAVGSGAVAVMAILPGVIREWLIFSGPRDSSEQATGVAASLSLAMVIRLFGTVAMLGLSSYHMPNLKHESAGLILSWYLYLTFTEVVAIARRLPGLDKSPLTDAGDARSTAVLTHPQASSTAK